MSSPAPSKFSFASPTNSATTTTIPVGSNVDLSELRQDPNFDPVVDVVENKSSKQDISIYFGIELEHEDGKEIIIDEALKYTETENMDFVIAPLFKSFNSKAESSEIPTKHLMERSAIQSSAVLLKTSEWANRVIGKLSPSLFRALGKPETMKLAEYTLRQEFEWASHLYLPAVLLPTPEYDYVYNLARIINNLVQSKSLYTQVWMRIPAAFSEAEKSQLPKEQRDPWILWNTFRTMCEHHASVGAVVELTEDLPTHDTALWRWFGDNLKAIVVPFDLFTTDAYGYPCLPPRHQQFVYNACRYDPQFIFTGTPSHEQGLFAYVDYFHRLYSQAPPLTEVELYEKPYWDYLQQPLQPLMDNLESQTYEVFEKDPVKYQLYEKAIYKALIDRHNRIVKEKTQSSGAPTNTTEALMQGMNVSPAIVMVVGAGRGPLVKAALRASRKSGKPIKVYAVEKNPNALVILHHFKQTIWKSVDVEIIYSDMREWTPPEKADILVSELLGSFGDNELSPECLDGAQRLLKQDVGISIPADYTSYLAPLGTAKLYNDVKAFGDAKHFEVSYVVKVHKAFLISDIQECFKFEHPNDNIGKAPSSPEEQMENSRFTTLRFTANATTLMHGFVGYFDSKLYEGVLMSIHPSTHSPGMFSWFPIFFPLRNPVLVRKGDTIEVNFWRVVTKHKVWYEWSLTQPTVSHVQNVNGRSHSIQL